MANNTASLRHFVLGLLVQEPMSGYDVKRLLSRLSWLIGSPSSGSLYPILRGLLREGLVTVEIIPGLDRPPRKVYSIAPEGRETFRRWLDEPFAPDAPLKAFVMRLLLSDSLMDSSLRSHLQQRRTQVAGRQAALARMTRAADGDQDLGRRLTLDYGLTLASAELAWLDGKLAELSAGSLHSGAEPDGSAGLSP